MAVFYEEKRSKRGLKVRTKMPEEAGTGRVGNTLGLNNPRPQASDPIAAADKASSLRSGAFRLPRFSYRDKIRVFVWCTVNVQVAMSRIHHELAEDHQMRAHSLTVPRTQAQPHSENALFHCVWHGQVHSSLRASRHGKGMLVKLHLNPA